MKYDISIIVAVVAIIIATIAVTAVFVRTPETSIGAGTITGNELDDDAVSSEHIIDGSIVDEDIADSGISKIADESITLSDLTSEVLAEMSGIVDILDNSILGSKLANNSILNRHINDDASIDPSKISGVAWTANNDGLGSGLDADTLDSMSSDEFAGVVHSHSGLLVTTKVLDVVCSGVDFDDTYKKIIDIDTFDKIMTDSTIDIAFYGRISVGSMTGTGTYFELRIDDYPTTDGRVRAIVKSGETGSDGIHASMRGIFSDLAKGEHTVSMWVKSTSGFSGT
ncbi:MAG: hypothetical protein KAS52_08030, partial [Candidatus Heimdallarchaeota archaeon]|nr:hypothetical protein [Candidatus Heimdallarchaeota archaeon]